MKVITRRLLKHDSISIKQKGYHGCGELCTKGARQIRLFADQGVKRFIVCMDADGADPKPAHDRVLECVIRPSGVSDASCIVVPVQELEAWILADNEAVACVIPSFKFSACSNPESVASPKEYLERLSRQGRSRPLYSHATHNERVAEHLDLERLWRVCPSFRCLYEFVSGAASE